MSTMTPDEEAEYLIERQKRIDELKLKEIERKKREPFKTMAEVSHPDTLNALTGWREPSYAYILFEMPALHNSGNGAFRAGAKICVLSVENRPEREHTFYYYIRKGGRPIHYANFPTANDLKTKRQALHKMHNGPDGINPYDEMARLAEQTIQRREGVEKRISQVVGLEAKLELAREENRRLKEQIEGKNESAKSKAGSMASTVSKG